MQFEKIRRRNKSIIIIGGLITLGVIGAITILPSRAKYRVTDSIKIGEGVVNYKVPDINVVALYIKDDTEYVESKSIPSTGYTLNKEKSVCKIYDGSTSLDEAVIDNNITINYHDGVIGVDNISKRNTRCYLYFDKQEGKTIEDILASLNVKNGTPDFSKTATTDEGVFKVPDGMYSGTSYYWRGAVTNNYVKLANLCWRIVRINGDGTMRLIYDGTTCHANETNTIESIAKTSVAYNTVSNNSSYVGWTYTVSSQRPSGVGAESNAKIQLESWYNTNLKSYESKIADGKFCNDRNTQNNEAWIATGSQTQYYAGFQRLWTNYQPTLNCPLDDVYTLKVGLITADEVEMAGGKNGNNTQYYLYNGQNYWTMTPSRWSGGATVYCVDTNGSLIGHTGASWTGAGLRPVINLKYDVIFSSGNGTIETPYEVAS